jgi:hypothetical protein
MKGIFNKSLNKVLNICTLLQHLNIFCGSWLNILTDEFFKTNDELDKLIRHKKIRNYIKAQRLSWFGHLHRMPEDRMVKKVYKQKPMVRRPLGRPKNRWEDDIRNDMKN